MIRRACLLICLGLAGPVVPACRCERPRPQPAPSAAPLLDLRDDASRPDAEAAPPRARPDAEAAPPRARY